jgi:Novel STAND NTPase 1/TIR domain
MPTPKFHVFLSHSSADKPAVEELAQRLMRVGINPWLDRWNLIPGDPWQPAIETALAECAACAVFIGPGGIGAWQSEETRAAIDRRVAERTGGFRVIPVLLPGVERPERSKLPTFLVATTWVEFRRSLDDQEAFHRLVCGIRGIEPGAGLEIGAFDGVCPYRGLEVFDEEHHRFFFGREALTEWLVDGLRSAPNGRENRFLAIAGASGSGKSSLARAGLVPAIRRGELDGSVDWPISILRPGPDPLESLAVALTSVGGAKATAAAVQSLMAAIRADARTLHQTVRLTLAAAPASRRLVVLVDQFEEIFTLCRDETVRQALIDNLLHAATTSAGQTVVVLTMRADFYGKCATYPKLAEALSDYQVLVGPLTPDEVRRAIERPATLAGGEVETGLVELLIQDLAGQAGALPLLQFTLRELWTRRDGRRMTCAAYRDIGQLHGALKNRADAILAGFTEAEREICRRIFLRLTQPGEGTEDTKRRVSLSELGSARGQEEETARTVLQKLSGPEARLITIGPDGTSVEVAHEALIRGWPALRQWIDADRAGQRTLRRLTDSAREWNANARDTSFLYTGARLAVADEWSRAHPDELNSLETEFLSESRRARADELQAAHQRAIELTALAASRKRLIQRLTVAVVVSLLLVGLVSKVYFDSRANETALEAGWLQLQRLYAEVPIALSGLIETEDPGDAELARAALEKIIANPRTWLGSLEVANLYDRFVADFGNWTRDTMPSETLRESARTVARAFAHEARTGVLTALPKSAAHLARQRRQAYEAITGIVTAIRNSADYAATTERRRAFWEYYWARLFFVESSDVEAMMVKVGQRLRAWGKHHGLPEATQDKRDLDAAIDLLVGQLASER